MKGLLFHSEVFFTLFFWYEVEFLLSCWLRQCWSIWHVNILYCSFLFRKDWLILNQTKCSLTNKIFLTNKCVLKESICPWQWQKIYILMERSGFSLLFSTLDYMHLFFDLYVLKKYNQYFFQLILKISLSYSDQAQQPLKRKRKKKPCSVKDGFKVFISKLHPFSMKRLNADTNKVH